MSKPLKNPEQQESCLKTALSFQLQQVRELSVLSLEHLEQNQHERLRDCLEKLAASQHSIKGKMAQLSNAYQRAYFEHSASIPYPQNED